MIRRMTEGCLRTWSRVSPACAAPWVGGNAVEITSFEEGPVDTGLNLTLTLLVGLFKLTGCHRRWLAIARICVTLRSQSCNSLDRESLQACEDAMSSPNESSVKAVPAQLDFLAIYNPSLGATDETIGDQIVYYTSPGLQNQETQKHKSGKQDTETSQEHARDQLNEQLRRVGLAQGMVEFGRSFSEGQAVDTVETEKSRIILHELESGWWILAVR
jgi:hypothetical protein